MSLNPLAPAFLTHHQSSSNPPISLCNSTTLSLAVAQLICGIPPTTITSHVPSFNQHIADNTLLLPLLQPTNQCKPEAPVHQPTPGSSIFLPSSLQHQANCLQSINKTIQQFNHYLKAEHLDRQTLQLIVLLFQNDFALLRYLLFSPVETTSDKDITSKTPLLVLYLILKLTLTLTLTLLPLLFHFPTLVNPNFVVLPQWVLWDHPEQKQTILQTPISSPNPTSRKLLQLQCRTSHQDFANWNNCLPMNYQVTDPSLRVSTPNTISYTIKFASLNLAIQTLLFGKFSQ